MADSDDFPWVQALDRTWHRRPPGKPWITSLDGPNAETACGEWVPSGHVAQEAHGQFRDRTGPRCPKPGCAP